VGLRLKVTTPQVAIRATTPQDDPAGWMRDAGSIKGKDGVWVKVKPKPKAKAWKNINTKKKKHH